MVVNLPVMLNNVGACHEAEEEVHGHVLSVAQINKLSASERRHQFSCQPTKALAARNNC